MALVATTTTGPGILHQLTGVIAKHQGDIASVEILEGGPEASRTYLEIKLPAGADALLAELRAMPIVQGIEVVRKPTVTTSAAN